MEREDQKGIMRALHSGLSGGHFAAITSIGMIRAAAYWWPFLIRDVKAYVSACDQCQQTGAPSFQNHWPPTPIILIAPFEK